MPKTILYIGGSPCSGKSTVAGRIAKELGAHYFKVDERLNEYMKLAADNGGKSCAACLDMTPEEIWMRPPEIQCVEEFFIYDETAPFIFSDLDAIDAQTVITEGAAFTPQVMKARGLEHGQYICMIPNIGFQVRHYREREWVPYVLEGCSDKKEAFNNWMKRDELFAVQVERDCRKYGIPCIVSRSGRTEDETYAMVTQLLGL